MTRNSSSSSSLYFFKRKWNTLNYDNLEIMELDSQRRQITYQVREITLSITLRKKSMLFKEIYAKKQIRRRVVALRESIVHKPRFCPDAEKKAANLVKKIISQNLKLFFSEESILVTSMNQKTYLISNRVHELNGERRIFRCVDVKDFSLPPSDQILAKALVVAYRPELIYTLNGLNEYNDL